jgi:hypothetical protein
MLVGDPAVLFTAPVECMLSAVGTAAKASCMMLMCSVIDAFALPCSTPLGCEGSSPLLSGLGTGHPGDGRRTGSLCPCGACSLVVPLPGTLSIIPKKSKQVK